MPRCALSLLLSVLLVGPAAAQGKPARKTLEVGARSRVYLLQLPAGHRPDGKTPLVLALHGGGGTAEQFDRGTGGQMSREGARRGWIVAYPEGVAKGWNDGRPLTSRRDRQRAGVDDLAFLSALIDHLVKTVGADPARVYATGISNGGFMSFRLGCDLSEKLAAIAPVTANMTRVLEGRKPKRPLPVMILNGTEDPLVPYNGGEVRVLGKGRGKILSTAASVDWWVAHNGCDKTAETRTLPDKAPNDGARVEVRRYKGGREGSEVLLYTIRGGGHTWPGGAQYLPRRMIGGVCRDIDGCKHICDFFARHKRAARD